MIGFNTWDAILAALIVAAPVIVAAIVAVVIVLTGPGRSRDTTDERDSHDPDRDFFRHMVREPDAPIPYQLRPDTPPDPYRPDFTTGGRPEDEEDADVRR